MTFSTFAALIFRNAAAEEAAQRQAAKELEKQEKKEQQQTTSIYPKLESVPESQPLMDWNAVMEGVTPPKEVDPDLVKQLIADHFQRKARTSDI